jgi:tRNA pseudouridine38-40 synthase
VHAKSQIVNIKTDFILDTQKINSLNKILGDSISINSIKVVSSNFHARYGATERTYKYLVRDSKSNYPHLNKNTYQHYSLLNLEDLNKVAKLFIGEHNFSSFSRVEKFNNPERNIFSSKWIKKNEIYEYTIIANSFLRNMVRNIVGVQLAYSDQKISLKDILNELKKPSGERLNFIAPAHGLILWKVKY